MSKHLVFASLLAVSLTSLATAQTPVGNAEAKHYRLTVVVSLGQDSPIEQSFTVDIALGTPTIVTNEMVLTPLGDTNPALAAKLAPAAPKITVTAVAI